MIKFDNSEIRYLAVELPDSVKYYKYSADFVGEIAEIDRLLGGKLTPSLRRRLEIERVIAEGLCHDYKTDFEGLLARVREEYPSCTAENLEYIISLGQVDYLMRNGERNFQNSAASTVKNEHTLYLRRLSEPSAQPIHKNDIISGENIDIMKERGERAFRYVISEQMRFRDGAVREGERVRVHFPYPAPCASQDSGEIKLLEASHPNVYISDSEQRTACIEADYREGETFFVKFSYVNRAKYRTFDAEGVSSEQPSFYTEEKYPQIRFTPLIRELAAEIAGEEKNPLLLARRIYDWITENIRYSYMREYLYIDNIPENVILNRRGDCGAMSLLFITLCRYLGIPAKWESGSTVRFDHIGSHDWATFYVAPYGWLYADLAYGEGARTRGNTKLWNHLFGNLDPFRLVANTDVQVSFDPPKRFMRTDPYDNQSGEAETEERGLGFGDMIKSRSVESYEDIT